MKSIKANYATTPVQIGLGILIIIFSILAFISLVSPLALLPEEVELAIILFFIGIEKIITGVYRVGKYKWTIIGLGMVVIIFAGVALSLNVPNKHSVIVFLGISVFASGAARIVDGIHKESKRSKSFIIGVGALNIVFSVVII